MKRILFVAAVALIMVACGGSKETLVFENDGVSFSYPGDWKITDEESWDGNGESVAVEREGLDDSGIVTMNWIVDDGQVEDSGLLIDGLMSTYAGMMSNFTQVVINQAEYNGYGGTGMKYTGEVMGIAHTGYMYAVQGNGKIVLIVVQEADEDHRKNAAGFKLIEESFKIK